MVLSKENHFHYKRQQDVVEKHAQLKNNPKCPNVSMSIAGVDHTPIFLVQMQIGTARSSQRESLVEELTMKGVDVELKELMTKLK